MRRILPIVILLLLLPMSAMGQVKWDKYPNNVVLDLGDEGTWDAVHVAHPTVYYDGSEVHLWYAGSNGNLWAIGYARSPDGMNWEKYPGNPVLEDGISDVWDGEFVTQPCIVYNGSHYQMWYAGYDGSVMRIGHATSPNGINWTKDATNPVVELGADTEWDDAGVSSPGVLLEEGNYHLWYTGYDGTDLRIGYATGDDGVAWTKSASNPVIDLGAGSEWDDAGVSSPTVIITEMLGAITYRMWYVGYDGSSTQVGYATSTDDARVVWGKSANNPVLGIGEAELWDSIACSGPCVVLAHGSYHLWYTGHDGTNMRIGYADSLIPGDTSGNETISSYDAGLILQFVVGIIEEFPAQTKNAPESVPSLPSYQVSLPDISARSGEEVHVRLSIEDATGLFTGGLRITYDSAILQAVDVSALGMLSGSYWQANTDLNSEVRFAFAALNVLHGGGEMIDLTFRVQPGTEGRMSPLALASVDLNDAVPVRKWHGRIQVIPTASELLPNYPNPFNPETWIPYQLAQDADVLVRIYDSRGSLVRTIDLGEIPAGVYQSREKAAYWNGCNALGRLVASGTYFCDFEAGDFHAIRRMTIAK